MEAGNHGFHASTLSIGGKSAAYWSWYRLGLILSCIGLAFALRWVLDPVLQQTPPLFFFLCAVALVTWYGGWQAGVVAAAIASILADYFFDEPRLAWELSLEGVLGIVLFFGANVVLTFTLEKLRHTRSRLAYAEEKNRALLESIGDACFSLDAEGRLTYVNQFAQDYFGQPRSALLGRVIFEIIPELREGEFEDSLRRAVNARGPISFETFQASTSRWMTVNCHPIAGKTFVFLRDVTEGKRAEAEIRARQEQAKRTNAMIEGQLQQRTVKLQETINELKHFQYAMAVDMRPGLRVMQGFATVLLEELRNASKPNQQDLLTRIASTARCLDQMLTDALNYARVVRQDVPLAPVDVNELLKELIAAYPVFQRPHAEIQIQGTVPVVQANASGLTQCFFKLLNNAVKSVASGAVPRVRIWAEQREGFVRLWFEDNGRGLPAQLHPQIFSMNEPLGKEYVGTGMRMTFVRKVAERMGGRVGVESERGQGNRFWLELQGRSKDSRCGEK